VQIFDAPDGGNVFTYHGHSDTVYDATWSPDGKRIASTSKDGTIQVWDASSGNKITTFSGQKQPFYALWSPDGSRIASIGIDDTTVQIWNATTGQSLLSFTAHTSSVNNIDWSAKRNRIVSTSKDGLVMIWNPDTGQVEKSYPDKGEQTSWSPDGSEIATTNSAKHTVTFWNPDTGAIRFTYTPLDKNLTDIVGPGWSPDGMQMAVFLTYTQGQSIQVFDVKDGKNAFTYSGHADFIESFDWSPDGKYIASSSVDKTVQIWETHP
jgi:WD40 repeat protein